MLYFEVDSFLRKEGFSVTRLLIIGGSDTGISAAQTAREIDSRADVKVLVADAFPNYSICGETAG